MKSFYQILCLLLVLLSPSWSIGQEICGNGIDDDGDLLVDCFDPDCGFSLSVNRIVTQGNDDGEEEAGVVDLIESFPADLDFVPTKDVGIRFLNLNIPAGSVITNAYITFTAANNAPGATNIPIYCEATLTPLPFLTINQNISNRPKTTASVNWASTGAWTGGLTYNTPDLSAIIQERVSAAPAGSIVNVLNFLMEPCTSGDVAAWAAEAGGATSPMLHVDYTACYVEICNNGIDDDGDGQIDCEDGDCGSNYTLTQPVNRTDDDAEEDGGSVDIFDVGPISDLDFSPNRQVGVRFNNLDIPSGSVIQNAYISFVASANEPGAVDVPIFGESHLSASSYQVIPLNISSRTYTLSSMLWSTGAWVSGQTYQTPDLSILMQEVVDLLSPGTDLEVMNFIFEGALSGFVSAWAFEGGNAVAPRLFVQYAACGPELCNNGLDDDFDGLIDCYDPDCADATNCSFFVAYDCIRASEPDTVCIAEATRSAAGYGNRLSVMVADIDQDSTVELIALKEDGTGIDVLDPVTMAVEISFPANFGNRSNTLAIGQLDGTGYLEIAYIRSDRKIEMFRHNATTSLWEVISSSVNAFPSVSVVNNITGLAYADFNQDGTPEIYMNNRIFSFSPDPSCNGACIDLILDGDTASNGGARGSADFATFSSVAIDILSVADCGGDPECAGLELVAGFNVYSVDIAAGTITARRNLNDAGLGLFEDGQSVVADINEDGVLDVVVHGPYSGAAATIPNTSGALYAWTPLTNTLLGGWPSLVDRGVPIIAQVYNDDLADDGNSNNNSSPDYPEIVLMTANNMHCYNLNDLDNHLWNQPVVDPSGSTGITSFDFNGDGIDEITYRDEDNLRIMYGGPIAYAPTGVTLLTRDYGSPIPCTSRTSNEYPVVSDVDHDNEAELVVVCGNEIVVYESGCTPWLSARSIWNQFYYYGVNVEDDGDIPPVQQSTLVQMFPGTTLRPLNRTNFQISNYQFSNLIGVGVGGTNLVPAPNLTGSLDNIANTSVCGQLGNQIIVDYSISNFGDLSVPAGIHISFYNGDPSLPGATFIDDDILTQPIEVDSTRSFTAILPDQGGTFDLHVVINDDGSQAIPFTSPFPSEAECDYSDNFLVDGDFCSTALAVEWIRLSAIWPPSGPVQLSWSAKESASAWRYTLERSEDGTHFETVLWEDALALDDTVVYQREDPATASLLLSRLYYRIVLHDREGRLSVSNVVPLQRGQVGPGLWLESYQEGETLYAKYLLDQERIVRLQVLNHLGQVVAVQERNERHQSGAFQFDASRWSRGVYYLQLLTEGPGTVQKIIFP